jgi:1,2-phenylacetyl-CoA epoxidase catalytic subunit
MSQRVTEAELLARIERGERIESTEEMTEAYRQSLVHLIRHGEYWVTKLAGDPATHGDAQSTLNKWFIRTMNIFGPLGSPKNTLYRKYKLKVRDNDEVRQAFAAEVTEKALAVGLTVPEWIPVWERLPEEAQIPG